ncbi:MAG: hypothetical protein V4617_02915 [Gemmatimonadota bacterium]
MLRSIICAVTIAASLALTVSASSVAAQTVAPSSGRSIALEADALSYFVGGYSGIVNVTFRNKWHVALGSGRYEVPAFLLEEDDNFDAAGWKATSTSIQVLRVGYRFRGAMKNGPVLGAIVLNQNWRLKSETLGGETRFRPLSVGVTSGYYQHIGRHLYVYPTVAFTSNRVVSGSAAVKGTAYKVARFSPNASIHMGWERSW